MTVCCCYIDDVEPNDVHREVTRTARIGHKCTECGDAIEPGEKYEHVTLLNDGYWSTYKTCRLCLRIRADFFCGGWYYGNMRDDLLECIGFDYVDGPGEDDDA